ncbi:MAG TPA: 16S rRNA (cytidine(1402)-2'-O)-methyltransferase [Chloroflexota bacterium]|nr:16S rRNA (cytidine(1402)-2'-O)-methyltransferase [Chloroflexota bacterium]
MGKLYVVSTPIGNLEDVSLRALRVLREVALIAAEDTRVTRKLLSRYDIHTRLAPYHQHNQRYQSGVVLRALEAGDVALVSDAGTPVLSDPGQDLIRMAIGLGIDVVAVPGPSAITHALTVAGLEAEPFLFEGFLPSARGERTARLRELAAVRATLVVFEAPHRVRATLDELAAAFGDRQVAICRELTKLHEQVIRTTLAAARDQVPERGELTLVIEGAPLPRPPGLETAESRLRELLAAGSSRKDAAEAVSLELGLPKRQVYRLSLELE